MSRDLVLVLCNLRISQSDLTERVAALPEDVRCTLVARVVVEPELAAACDKVILLPGGEIRAGDGSRSKAPVPVLAVRAARRLIRRAFIRSGGKVTASIFRYGRALRTRALVLRDMELNALMAGASVVCALDSMAIMAVWSVGQVHPGPKVVVGVGAIERAVIATATTG